MRHCVRAFWLGPRSSRSCSKPTVSPTRSRKTRRSRAGHPGAWCCRLMSHGRPHEPTGCTKDVRRDDLYGFRSSWPRRFPPIVIEQTSSDKQTSGRLQAERRTVLYPRSVLNAKRTMDSRSSTPKQPDYLTGALAFLAGCLSEGRCGSTGLLSGDRGNSLNREMLPLEAFCFWEARGGKLGNSV